MKAPRKDTVITKRRLLEAAGEVFAEKGFHEAGIAEICELAGVNVAAVNYHFGGKEKLYVETWRHFFEESLAAHPFDGGVPASAPPEERLRGRISALIHRVTDENNREFHIAQNELAGPTGLLDDILDKTLGPLTLDLEGLLRELLGPRADPRQVAYCRLGITAQCFNPLVAGRRPSPKKKGGPGFRREIDDVAAYAEHVAAFSLAGIRELKNSGAGAPGALTRPVQRNSNISPRREEQ
ncbi:MAG: CerR family C-terminal domain-containing protein [Pseudomonadota bacterium]